MNESPTTNTALSILIVDDMPDNLRLLAGIVKQQGYVVRLARDGQMALSSARNLRPDLILLDIMMPDMDGYEVCGHLKADEQTHDIPIIFLSALDDTADKVKAFAVGGVDYITKPFQTEEVLARVKNHLTSRQLQKQLEERNARLREEMTERERVDQALRESEEKYRRVIEHVNEVIIVIQDGMFKFFNPKMVQLSGYSAQELEALPYLDTIHPDDREFVIIRHRERMQGQGLLEKYEFRCFTKSGDMLWIENNGVLIEWEGKPATLGFLVDITERKHAEEALAASQQKLMESYQREQERRKLSDTLREVAKIVSGSLETKLVLEAILTQLKQVITFHHATITLLEGSQCAVVAGCNTQGWLEGAFSFPKDRYPLNLFTLETRQPVLVPDVSHDPRWRAGVSTNATRSFINAPLLVQNHSIGLLGVGRSDDVHYTEEDAETVFAFASQVAIALENARLVEQTQIALLELEKALEHLKTTQANLIESEKMAALGKLIANIAHEINTPLGAIQASSQNIVNSFQETIHTFPHLMQNLSPEQQSRFLAFIQRAITEKQQLTSREERRLRRTLRQELERHDIHFADELSDTLVDIGIYADVEQFVPLLKTEWSAELVKTAYMLANQQHNTRNILLAVERASKVVAALRTYATDEWAGQQVEISVRDSIEVVLTLYRSQLQQGIEVITQYAEMPPLFCYPDELHQVWRQLIHNAIQAMQGRGRLEITVTSQERRELLPNSSVIVRITDSGPGVPDDIKDRIFEPFFTTRLAGEGSGLGLDICRRIIEKHQGRIEFESEPGKTTFSVSLPVLSA